MRKSTIRPFALAVVLGLSLVANAVLWAAFADQRFRCDVARDACRQAVRECNAAGGMAIDRAFANDGLRRRLAGVEAANARLGEALEDARLAVDFANLERDEAAREVAEARTKRDDAVRDAKDAASRVIGELRESLEWNREAVGRQIDLNLEINAARRSVERRYVELATRHGESLDGIPGDVVLEVAARDFRRWVEGMKAAIEDLSGASFRGVQGPARDLIPSPPPAPPAPPTGEFATAAVR